MRSAAAQWLALSLLAILVVLPQAAHPDPEDASGHRSTQERAAAWRSGAAWRGGARVRRQVSEVFRLYNQLSKENREDTMQAVARVREILDRVFAPAPMIRANATSEADSSNGTSSREVEEGASTPKPPARLNREELLANLRRNLRGLGRLFMRELRAALRLS